MLKSFENNSPKKLIEGKYIEKDQQSHRHFSSYNNRHHDNHVLKAFVRGRRERRKIKIKDKLGKKKEFEQMVLLKKKN